jgi:hypothetical protein
MKGLLALAIQDFRRLLSNALFWVITVTLVLIILVINLALPKSITAESLRVFAYNTGLASEGVIEVSSEEELRQAVQEGEAIGLLGDGEDVVTILHPGLSGKYVRAIMLMLDHPEKSLVEVEKLDDSIRTIPFNERMAPVFICFEALVIGFILGGALMLSEKEEGTIRALRISPMGVDRYLISKTILFSAIAVIYALIMAVFSVGFDFSAIRFILLSFFGSAVFSLIGLAYTTFFKDLSSWFFSMAVLLSINMLPVVSFMNPTFSPFWIRLIPSYPMIFEYENILFGLGRDPWIPAASVALWCVAAYGISRVTVGRRLLARGGDKK